VGIRTFSSSGGSSSTAISLTAGAAVTYSIAGGVISGTGGILDGWRVQNDGDIDSLAESVGGYVTLTMTASAMYRWGRNSGAAKDGIGIYLPDNVDRDFDIQIKFDSTLVGDTETNFCAAAWRVNAVANECGLLCTTFTDRTTTDGNLYANVLSQGARDFVSDTTAGRAWADTRWIRVSRTGQTIAYFHRDGDSDAWTSLASEIWDGAGSEVFLGFGFGTSNTTNANVRIYAIEGSYYKAGS